MNFWFTDATSQALPLVALQYQDCEVKITLNPINTLYSILDASGYRVAPDYITNSSLYNINTNNPNYGVAQDASGEMRNFLVDLGYTTPTLNSWPLNPRIQCTFVYLAEVERTTFATRPLTYIFPQVMYIPYEGIFQTRQTYDLDIHNPITRLLFITRRSDSQNRNDFNNFTNWYTYPYAPFSVTQDVPDYLQSGGTSGLLIANSQKDILRSVRILCDGNEIQELLDLLKV